MTVITTLARAAGALAAVCAVSTAALAVADDDAAPALREHLDLAYRTDADADPERHKLNLVVPESAEPVPLLIWLPQGAWAFGSRGRETSLARQFAEEGIAVAAVDHRMSSATWANLPRENGAVHPDHIRDSVAAVKWAIEHGAEYGIDTDNIFVGGYSSGAQLAALMVTNTRFLDEAGLDAAQIRAVIPVSGAYDIERYYHDQIEEMGQENADSHIFEVFGRGDGVWADTSPNAHLDALTTPMLVISESYTHPFTVWFEEDIAAAGLGDLVEFEHYLDHDHASLWRGLGADADIAARDRIVDYVKAHVR